MIATGGDDFIVRVFTLSSDFKQANLLHELKGHFEPVNSVDISPDKKFLVSSSSDKSCMIFNLEKKG
jgi:WD40 repeat protein